MAFRFGWSSSVFMTHVPIGLTLKVLGRIQDEFNQIDSVVLTRPPNLTLIARCSNSVDSIATFVLKSLGDDCGTPFSVSCWFRVPNLTSLMLQVEAFHISIDTTPYKDSNCFYFGFGGFLVSMEDLDLSEGVNSCVELSRRILIAFHESLQEFDYSSLETEIDVDASKEFSDAYERRCRQHIVKTLM